MTTLQDNYSTSGHSQGDFGGAGRELKRPNISSREQAVSLLVGSGLVLAGLRRFSLGGLAVAGVGAMLIQRGVTKHCPVYERLGMDTSDEAGRPEEYFERGIHVEESVTIKREAMELYRIWRDLENLPGIMGHVESVRALDGRRSHWVVRGPMGHGVEWDAEVINDEPGRLIAWRSLGGADVDNAGSVRFTSSGAGGRGTEVRVVLDYVPPAGRVGAVVARALGEDPGEQIREDLRRFKQRMEGREEGKREDVKT